MLTTLLTASSLLFGQLFPEAPVAPAKPAVVDKAPTTPDTPPIPPAPPGGITSAATDTALQQPVEVPAPGETPPPPPPVEPPIPPPPPVPAAEPVPPPTPLAPPLAAPRPGQGQTAFPFNVRVLGTVTFPNFFMGDNKNNFLVGLRSELDVSYFSAMFMWDRQGYAPISLSETFVETSYWNGLIGASVWAPNKGNRIRFLGGVSAINDYYSAKVGPTIGTTLRFGIPIIGVEGAILYTPVGFQQVDGRVEAVLTLFIFELRAGFRGRWVQRANDSDPFVQSSGGFTVSLGLTF